MSNKSDATGASVNKLVSDVANTHNPVVWPLLSAAILALLLTTFIACCICVELRRYAYGKVGKSIAVCGYKHHTATELTCHTGSHSVTCYPAEAASPALTPAVTDLYSVCLSVCLSV